MRLPVNRASALTIAALLVACGSGQSTASTPVPPPLPVNGPAADYPVVIGAPFVVEGVTYTPEDKLNFDQVGYAGRGEGEGVSIAHRTLPLPCYAEVTSLETGRTILVRVTRRGPMTGSKLIELSPGAASQLGVTGDNTPIRIRRVNPPEIERAALRAGGQAPARMDTPVSLVNVLRRKLDPALAVLAAPGSAPNPAPVLAPAAVPASPAPALAKAIAAKPSPARPAVAVKPQPSLTSTSTIQAEKPPIAIKAPAPAQAPGKSGRPISPKKAVQAEHAPAPKTTIPAKASGHFVIQVGAFSSSERGSAAAHKVGGSVSPVGKLFRVRVGPFSSRGEAEAALAKAKGAGYSDARIQRAD